MAVPEAPTTILIVEDNRDVLALIERMLRSSGFLVRKAYDGEAAIAAALDVEPALVILDIGLPKRSGLEVAAELRRRGFHAPVLMLTARDTVSDKVTGLDAGADDYLAKPFDTDELLARVKALLRRATLRADDALIRVGDLSLDPLSRQVKRGKRDIALTQREYALLEYLMKNAGRELTRDQITEHVWRQDAEPSTNVVDVYINYLRKKIDTDGLPPLLHTVRGVGYVLRP
ncbi:MAG: response regulator transcription factor [Gemmatimonadaceae bacterium]|nr:response regulator transcription factor [Gemmatimonadaceae bacterium]NUQ91703.1 response regulator transcription factor [Gemmatimonadaceae bacterium]NUR19281.1 response regulator transcription factor [Gemmatimonadaceae bacterium]